MSVVDAHHHLWDLSAHDQPWLASDPELAPLRRNFALADLAAEAAAQGVTATVLVQTVSEPWETPEMLALAATGGLVAGVVGWTDLEAADVAGSLAALRARPGGARLAGIRHPVLVEPDARWLARPAVRCGLAAVAAAGLAYDVVGEPRHLPAAAEAAAALPGLRFVLDHLGNPDVTGEPSPSWTAGFQALAAQPNVVAKLSGILGVPARGPAGTADARSRSRRRAPAAVLPDRARCVRAAAADVRLGLAGQYAVRALPGRPCGGAVADRRTQPGRAGSDLQRHRPARLPAAAGVRPARPPWAAAPGSGLRPKISAGTCRSGRSRPSDLVSSSNSGR